MYYINYQSIKKQTIMSTLARLITASIVALFMTSCQFDFNFGEGVVGDGNVITIDRKINDDFNSIKVSRGIEVYITQGNSVSLKVEADGNLHDVITTEVDSNNGVLRVSANENIKSSKSKKVILSVININRFETSSGAYVYSENTIKTDILSLESTSGSHMDLTVETDRLTCETTSGAGIKLNGNTENLKAEATSGSYIKATNLDAEVSRVSASSGASVAVNTSKELTASASSGANIKYTGNPEKVNKSSGVSGSIKRD